MTAGGRAVELSTSQKKTAPTPTPSSHRTRKFPLLPPPASAFKAMPVPTGVGTNPGIEMKKSPGASQAHPLQHSLTLSQALNSYSPIPYAPSQQLLQDANLLIELSTNSNSKSSAIVHRYSQELPVPRVLDAGGSGNKIAQALTNGTISAGKTAVASSVSSAPSTARFIPG